MKGCNVNNEGVRDAHWFIGKLFSAHLKIFSIFIKPIIQGTSPITFIFYSLLHRIGISISDPGALVVMDIGLANELDVA